MAGSRLEKFGTVFTRVRDLMRSGVIKSSNKPVWYDVYKAFPPHKDPLYVKPQNQAWARKCNDVPEIFYREDKVRAKFYEVFLPGRPFDLSRSSFVSTCQRFVEKHSQLQGSSDLDDSALFEETARALLTDGVLLRRRGDPLVAAESRQPLFDLKLKEMLAEQTTAGIDEAADQNTQTEKHTNTHSNTQV